MELMLAPLLGLSQASFRKVLSKPDYGWDSAMAPFVATNQSQGPLTPSFKDLHPSRNKGLLPLEPQLLSKSGQDFARVANKLKEEYSYNCVNWNLGCPSPTVTSRARGAGMLLYPDAIDKFLDEACSGFSGTISVKMRLGMHQPREWEKILPILNRYPLAYLAIHARTADQQYEGQADLAMFFDLAQASNLPLVYNGDITNPAQILELKQRLPNLYGIMIGRAAVSEPGLAAAIKSETQLVWPLDREGRKNFEGTLYNSILAEVGEYHSPNGAERIVLGRMKEYWAYWQTWFLKPGPSGLPDHDAVHRLLRPILKSKTLQEYREVAIRLLDRNL